MMSACKKKKKGKTSKFVGAGSNNWNERERERRELITWKRSTGKNGKKNKIK